MNKRRNFIKKSILGTVGASSLIKCDVPTNSNTQATYPRIISTWNHGLSANKEAWKNLMDGKNGISAVEAGVKISEADPKVRSVGYGGFPDREGIVTLDACIMDKNSNCGSVSFLQNIKHPISVARLVMEQTPHVMLSGKGALDFAISKGFEQEELLTKESKKDWIKWKEESKYKPVINIENHDTISMLLIDNNGDLFGACTTSGAAWKMHGRVGDSPIIGAGLFLDNEVGAAAATGLGEAVIRTSGSAMVVELMRQGHPPLEACKLIVDRISKIHRSGPDWDYLQVGFIAINKKGEYAGYSLKKGFDYAVCDNENQNSLLKADYSI
ncbi:MAG: N(4)-(beta-N-acetylglucosaminyl)-L-asparaginase [Flavobacteriaceae bacterium]|nr:N(4)-(beta-N-acetylglucosaminyl)-L-asparaginase [Flavobacteriaceae bacterium]MBT4958679.1 N(4)-(beta-N-acetylglucosaminyl)-L-asparaginase [Flavobacteriaceae bacterium]MBT7623822.1 N(4)-(beta-N-acetylglucosaminyl)-L-asparaginase [Flavobacteriaceae bacterium]MDG1830306.1 N(4)-(beta-N-acetylglucosaminyl)-L-asparaginase [Flavobacteriaceae bacterium]